MGQLVELKYTVTPATIEANYEAMEAKLKEELKKFDVVVTEDTVSEARQLAADINKIKIALNEAKKSAVKEASAPIVEMENKLKALMSLCADGRKSIIDQIAAFDERKRLEAKEKVVEYIDSLYAEKSVREKYRTLEPDDWIKVSSLTAKGNLTAAVKKAIDKACESCESAQDRYQARVDQLAHLSSHAQLSTPVVESDVPHLLDERSDVTYGFAIDEHIRKAKSREQAAEDAAAAKIELARQASEQAATPDLGQTAPAAPLVSTPPLAPQPRAVAPDPEPAEESPVVNGKQKISVTCNFKTEVKSTVTDEAVEKEIRRVLTNAGIKTLSSVHIARTA